LNLTLERQAKKILPGCTSTPLAFDTNKNWPGYPVKEDIKQL
jgi:hypothetical protein